MKITPLHPHLGARVEGVQVHAIDDAAFARVFEAFQEYSVLVFPEQRLTDEQQMAFSERFGPLERTIRAVGKEDRLHPNLVDLSNIRFILLYSLFRPIVNVSYAVDRAIWGYTSFGFHVTNVALHAVAVGLFFGWCTRAFADAYRADPTLQPEWPAFFAAATFAVHPMLTEGAGYISGRSEVLCSIGFLGCLILARRAIRTGALLPAAGAVIAAVFALASKETAIAVPVVLLAYDAWVLSPSESGGGDAQDGWRRRLWRVYVPAIPGLWSPITMAGAPRP